MNEASESSLPKRLYPIQDDVCHYRAGHLSSGNQVLMDEVHRIEFDTEGNLLAAFCQETSQETVKVVDRDGNILVAYPQEPRQSVSMMLPFTPGTISVKKFFLPELWLGIRDLPDHYQEFLDQPENANEEERHYYPKEIDAWRECGNFVLWWNEDYDLNEDGELESS